MKRNKITALLVTVMVLMAGLAIWGPEALARYRDKGMLNHIRTEEAKMDAEGYRYSLTNQEKLFLLSKCLSNQVLPESEQNMELTLVSNQVLSENEQNTELTLEIRDTEYIEIAGSYALVVNRRDSTGQPISERKGIQMCDDSLKELQRLKIVPEDVKGVEVKAYSAAQYSAIEVPEPRNNVLVWKISLSTDVQNADRTHRLLDAYVDVDTGKIYEFYVRCNIYSWEDVHPDELIQRWAEYMGLGEPREYTLTNPLSETTPYFKQYVFDGMDEETTLVTVGYYEGINELFLKISQ